MEYVLPLNYDNLLHSRNCVNDTREDFSSFFLFLVHFTLKPQKKTRGRERDGVFVSVHNVYNTVYMDWRAW